MSSFPTRVTIVIDASLAVSALLPTTSDIALHQFEDWRKAQLSIKAPDLWYAEVVTAIRKAVYHNLITYKDGLELLRELPTLGVEIVSTDERLYVAAFEWAERLGQSKAYDGFYLALAQGLGVELWTLDKHLVNRARQVGVNWVRLVG